MGYQVFMSYRRDGGDITAKLICEALKNKGYSVFYDYDSIHGGFFDEKILTSIEECNDFILVLPKNSLDRCVNEDDWVRTEICCALKNKRNIVPVMLPGFEFPKDLPEDIGDISRINGVQFIMAYFEGVIDTIQDRLISKPSKILMADESEDFTSENLQFTYQKELNGYSVAIGECTDTELRIPSTYQGKAVVAIAEDGFRDCSVIKTVVLPETIKSIGRSAFNGCTLLEDINLPNNVREIGKWAFYNCSSLKSISIPRNVQKIGARAFADCTSLLQFQVDPDNRFYCACDKHLYTKDKKVLMAYACGRTEDTYSVPDGVITIADSAFSNSSALSCVTLPDSVTHIGQFAFMECISLASVTLPKKMVSIEDYAFKRCSSLVSVTIPDGVQVIGEDAFRGCTSLETAILPPTVKSIGESAFYECGALERINIPSNVETIGKWAFYLCSSLESIIIPKGVKSIGARAFSKCASLKKISVSMFNRAYRAEKHALLSKDGKRLCAYAIGCAEDSYTIPKGVTHIEDSVFCCSKLKHITISGEVTDVGEYSFFKCEKLEMIKFNGTVKQFESIDIKSNSFNKTTMRQIHCTDGIAEV